MSGQRRGRRGRGGQGGHEPRVRIRTREVRAIELATLGHSQHEIAADLGVTQAAVSKILKRVENRFLREINEALERHKARHTLQLQHLYAESVRAWNESKGDTTRRRQRKTQGGPAGLGADIAEIVVENQHGDPRYLEEARKTLADLRKLWGLDAPQRLEVQASRNPYDGMSEDALREELARQTALLDATRPVPGLPVPPSPVSASIAPEHAADAPMDASGKEPRHDNPT